MRIGRVIFATVLGAAMGIGASADAAPKGKTARPQQIVPTGAEDAPSGARSARATDTSGEEALERATSRSTDGLVEVKHRNGMVSLDLEGRFQQVMRVHANPDGTYSASCDDAATPAAKGKAAKSRKTVKAAAAAAAAAAAKAAKVAPAPATTQPLEEM